MTNRTFINLFWFAAFSTGVMPIVLAFLLKPRSEEAIVGLFIFVFIASCVGFFVIGWKRALSVNVNKPIMWGLLMLVPLANLYAVIRLGMPHNNKDAYWDCMLASLEDKCTN